MASAIKPPDFLDSEAKKEWDRVMKILKRRKMLDQTDRGLIVAYCEAWGTFADASAALKKLTGLNRLVQKTKHNNLIPNTVLGIRNNAMKMMEKFAKELGFTPKSRDRGGRRGGNRGRSAKDFVQDVDDD